MTSTHAVARTSVFPQGGKRWRETTISELTSLGGQQGLGLADLVVVQHRRAGNKLGRIRDDADVVVAGGGFGGLSVALQMVRLGLAVTLLEKDAQFSEIGAGVNMGPNAVRELRNLGVLDEVIERGFMPKFYVIRDATHGSELTRQDVASVFERRYGAPVAVVHRATLLQILVRAAIERGVDVHTSAEVTRVTTEGARASAHVADGRTFVGDIVVGADGAGSLLRRQVSDDQPVAEGFAAYRGTIPLAGLPVDIEPQTVNLFLGSSGHMTQYPVDAFEDPAKQTISHAAVFRSSQQMAIADPSVLNEELKIATGDWIASLQQVISLLPRDRHWVMCDRDPIDNWIDGRLVLIGDAAHPMLQYLGQGAAQALEDASALAYFVREHVLNRGSEKSWDAAIRSFNSLRAPRVARVQLNARLFGMTMHASGLMKQIRDAAFLLRDQNNFRYTDWLYSEEAARPRLVS